MVFNPLSDFFRIYIDAIHNIYKPVYLIKIYSVYYYDNMTYLSAHNIVDIVDVVIFAKIMS